MKLSAACLVAGLALITTACTTTGPQPGETALTTSELRQLFVGKTLHYSGPHAPTTRFDANGRYETRAAGGRWVDRGRYSFDDNQECVHSDTRPVRCGQYVRSGSGYVFIRTRGDDVGTRLSVTAVR